MAVGATLPFEYLTRASQFVELPVVMEAQLQEERDEQLEDYLAKLAADVASLMGP